jgi:hypothetical protein
VTPIEVATNTADTPIPVGTRPQGIAINPTPCGTTGTLSGATTVVCTYTTSGSDTCTVPPGVTSISADVIGAQGGNFFLASEFGDITSGPGGDGGQATGTLTNLTPGQVLQINVAGKGANGTATSFTGGQGNGISGGQGALGGFGGSNGGVPGAPGDANGAAGGSSPANGGNGSGGGGASDVRLSATGCATLTCGLNTRVLIGPGGGGAAKAAGAALLAVPAVVPAALTANLA